MYVITAHQRHGRTDGRTSSDPMTATLLKHVAVKTISHWPCASCTGRVPGRVYRHFGYWIRSKAVFGEVL